MNKKPTNGSDQQDERLPGAEAGAAKFPSVQDPKDQMLENLQLEIEKLRAELADANDKMLRFRAESENIQRRSRIDVENAHKYGVERLARELVNVVDSLDRGLELHDETEHQKFEHMREGMELTHKLLLDTMDKFGIKQVDPRGNDFDPKMHEALTTQATSEMPPNKVLTVVQKGFTIQDRVLRPARVVVAKAPEDTV